MELAKPGDIKDFCQPNALCTFKRDSRKTLRDAAGTDCLAGTKVCFAPLRREVNDGRLPRVGDCATCAWPTVALLD